MGNYANTAGPRVRSNTKRDHRTGAWFSAPWASSIGLDSRRALRAAQRPGETPRWRRHLPHGALAALLMGIVTIGAPSTIHPGEAGQTDGGGASRTRHGSNPAAGDIVYPVRGGPGLPASHGGAAGRGHDASDGHAPDAPLASETSGDHETGGPHDLTIDHPTLTPTLTHFFGSGHGGGYGGGYGGGGGGSGGSGGGGSGGPQGEAPTADQSGKPGEPEDLTPPGSPNSPPGLSTRPSYVVDPDAGPHDPPGYTPPEWTSQSPATELSAVPEPKTWLMMLAGFGTLGCMLRLRRGQAGRLRA